MKAFVSEAGSASVITLLDASEDRFKSASVLVAVEMRSAIRKRQYLGDITPHQADGAIFSTEFELAHFTLAPVTSSVLRIASEVIERQRLRTLDAIQLATAIEVKRSLGASDTLQFVVSDKKLLLAALSERLDTWNPESTTYVSV